MALPKALSFTTVLLLTAFSIEIHGYGMYLDYFLEEPKGVEHAHSIAKRAAIANSYDIELVLNVSDLTALNVLLNNFTLPYVINGYAEITNISTTTVCSPNGGGYKCQCEAQYAWPSSYCSIYGSCDLVFGNNPCDCINAIPANYTSCQPYTGNLTETIIELEVFIPSNSTPNVTDIFRSELNSLPLPYIIQWGLTITSINLTTVCSPNTTGTVQCTCEAQYGWSCDQCQTYGVCSNSTNSTTDTCSCINNIPPSGQFCEPVTSLTPCPGTTSPPTTLNTTQPVPTPTNMTTNASTSTTTTLNTTESPTTPTTTLNTTESPTTPTTTLNTTVSPTTPTTTLNTTVSPTTPTTTLNTTESPTTPTTTLNTTVSPTTPTTTLNTTESPTTPTTTLNTTESPTTPTTTLNTTESPTTPTTTLNTTESPTTPTTTLNTTVSPTTPTTTLNTTVSPTTPTTTLNTTVSPTTQTTTTSTTPTTTSPTTPTTTTPPASQNFSITMDIPFDPAYNNPDSQVFQDISTTITNAAKNIPGFISATLIQLRSGSVIADFTVTASSPFQPNQTTSLLAKIATTSPYKVITHSTTPLNIAPSVAFENTAVTLTCQPPANLNFSSTPTAQWQFGGATITNSLKYTISIQNGNAMLTVNQVASSDAGTYTCTLRDNSIFQQSGTLTVKTAPDIQVTPVSKNIVCVNGNNQTVLLTCCVQSGYQVQFLKTASTTGPGTGCITYNYVTNCASSTTSFICEEITYTQYTTTITLTEQKSSVAPTCVSVVYGSGNVGDAVTTSCNDTNMVGQKIFVCQRNGQWVLSQDNCVLTVISNLLSQSKFLDSTTLPQFLGQLGTATINNSNTIVASTANIGAIVNILSNVATISSSVPINSTLMRNVLNAVDVLISDQAANSWSSINTNATAITSTSSLLLNSIETITAALTNDSFTITTPLILLTKTTFSASFSANLNSSVVIDIPVSTNPFNSITTILFKSMNNVLPPRDDNNDTDNTINGNVILVKSNNTVNNVSFTFDLFNGSLSNPLCVFWNFSLFNGSGGWDNMGCSPVFSASGNVTCNCNHLTSFSILMSPYIPPDIAEALNWITYIGVGISMLSLVICLIIEAVIWRKIRNNSTSYLRHVSLVNIAVSLLIADIWFIIGASISDAHSENASACSAATFFIHLFYLALFFWMLASALLLLYRAVSVFGGALSENSMLAIGFSLGYGAPLIIAIITIAVTAPKNTYIRKYQQMNTCWLNWSDSKALLAFVIPALLIVAINLVILLIVLYKMLRSRSVGDSTRSDERHALVVIVKCLAVLTPLFGTTWGLGVGTMVDPSNIGIQVTFAVFNSLQGFFILVFGTVLDKKVRSELAAYSRSSTSGTTQSTSANSSNGLQFWRRNRRRARAGYNVTSAAASNTASGSETYNYTNS